MKKNNLLYVVLAAVALLGMYGCMSDLPQSDDGLRASNGEAISIRVSMPQNEVADVNSRIVYDDDNLDLKWEDSDKLAIVGYSNGRPLGKSILSLSECEGENHAVFSGNSVAGATQYDVYYPAEAVNNLGELVLNFDNQIQKANNSTEHLKKNILLKQAGNQKLTVNDILLKDKDILLQMQNSIIRFELSNLSVETPVSLNWVIVTAGGGTLSRVLGIQNVDISKDKKFVGYMCVPSMNVQAKNIIVTVQGQKETGSTLDAPVNSYTEDVNKTIVYAPNVRYTASIGKWNLRLFYESDYNMGVPGVFSPNSVNASWNASTKKGYLDFDVSDVSIRSAESIKGIGYLIINGINAIESDAFKNCTSFKRIDIPKSVTNIGNHAFSGSRLDKIVIPGSVQHLDNGVFAKCTSLSEVVFGNGVQSIGAHSFLGCTSLATVSLSNSVEEIGANAFEGCSSLQQITFPENVNKIGAKVFLNCNSLGSLTVLAENPPVLATGDNPLGLNSWGKIYVPSLCVDKYKTSWTYYKNRIFAK